DTLGNSLCELLEEGKSPFFFLIVGGASSARLRFEAGAPSLFSRGPVPHVPPPTVAEGAEALKAAGLEAARAGDVHAATGGLPGLLEEALLGGSIDPPALVARLSQSPSVLGVLRLRLSEDDRRALGPTGHARWALQEMLAGRPVRKLAEV